MRAAIAGAGVVAAVVEAVVVSDFGIGGDVAEGGDPDAAIFFGSLAVPVAAMVDEHGRAEAVDNNCAVSESKEIGDGVVRVESVGFFFADVSTGILGDTLSLADKRSGVATSGVDG